VERTVGPQIAVEVGGVGEGVMKVRCEAMDIPRFPKEEEDFV